MTVIQVYGQFDCALLSWIKTREALGCTLQLLCKQSILQTKCCCHIFKDGKDHRRGGGREIIEQTSTIVQPIMEPHRDEAGTSSQKQNRSDTSSSETQKLQSSSTQVAQDEKL